MNTSPNWMNCFLLHLRHQRFLLVSLKMTPEFHDCLMQSIRGLMATADTTFDNGPLARYVKLRVGHAPGMAGTVCLPPRVSNPDMHQGTCVTHVPWCMPGSLTSGFHWIRWWGKRSRHSRRMRNPQFCVSGKRPIAVDNRHKQSRKSTTQEICTRFALCCGLLLSAFTHIPQGYFLVSRAVTQPWKIWLYSCEGSTMVYDMTKTERLTTIHDLQQLLFLLINVQMCLHIKVLSNSYW